VPIVLAELPRGLVEFLLQAFLVTVFIVLPIVRGIRESLAKKRELELKRTPADEAGEGAALDEARRRWEALLRGEAVAEPEPEPERPAAAPPPLPRARASDAPAQPQLAGRISPLPDVPSEAEAEAAESPATADSEHYVPDEAETALRENDRRLLEERARREEFLRFERDETARPRESIAPAALTTLADQAQAPRGASAARSVLQEALGAAPDRRAALRRAVVFAEVLGPPVSLRDPDSGPVSLRRTA
jgi:hypothetical protein